MLRTNRTEPPTFETGPVPLRSAHPGSCRCPMRHTNQHAPPRSDDREQPSISKCSVPYSMLHTNHGEPPTSGDDDRMSRLKRTAALIQAYTNPAAAAAHGGSGVHGKPASDARRARTRRRLNSADPVITPEVRILFVHAAQVYVSASHVLHVSELHLAR